MVVMKKFLCFMVLCALLGCSDLNYVDNYYEQTKSALMSYRELAGKLYFPEPFEVTSLKIFELDSNWEQVKEIEAILDTNFRYPYINQYKFSYHTEQYDFSNPLVQLVVSGTWKNNDSLGVPVEFEKIEDITTTQDSIHLNLFDHLMIPRVKQLIKEGYPFDAAKKKAEVDLLLMYLSGPIKDNYARTFAYGLFLYGETDSSFVENIEQFRVDFAKGSWLDFRDHVKSADYITLNWLPLYHKVSNWDYTSLNFFKRIQETSYGLTHCSRSGEIFVINDSTSAFYKDSLVCEEFYNSGNLRRILRPFTDLEKKIGVCVYDSSKVGRDTTTVVEFEDYIYMCSHLSESEIPSDPDYENWWKRAKSGL